MAPHIALSLLIGCGAPPGHRTQETASDPVVHPTSTATIQFEGPTPQNLLMISVDTWSSYAPFLASLADSGFLLDNHTTCSNWTYAGTTCTLLGMYNVDNGFLPKMPSDYRDPVPAGTRFLASHLLEPGYHNLLVSGNSWLGPKYKNAQGYHSAAPPPFQNTAMLLQEGISRLEAAVDTANDKWFLHVHLMEPHVSYNPPDSYLSELDGLDPLPWDFTVGDEHYEATRGWPDLTPAEQALLEAHLRIRYAAEIRYMDDQIAAAFTDMDARGLLDDTLVLFWSDHGEAFWEHGHQTHAWTLHRPENDGVAFFWAKNIVPNVWPGPTSSIDLTPTLLSLLEIDIPPELTGMPVGEAPANRYRYGYSISRTVPVQSIQSVWWKLIYQWNGTVELYNLFEDPAEENDLYTPDHPMAGELWEALRPRVEATGLLAEEWTITWPEGLD